MVANQSIPDVILCSSALRTQQTLELILAQWESLSQRPPRQVLVLDELYLAPAARILSIASQQVEHDSILVLGHNPGMDDLASYFGQQSLDMPTGAIASLESVGRNWPDDWLQVSSWVWRGLVKPRNLGE